MSGFKHFHEQLLLRGGSQHWCKGSNNIFIHGERIIAHDHDEVCEKVKGQAPACLQVNGCISGSLFGWTTSRRVNIEVYTGTSGQNAWSFYGWFLRAREGHSSIWGKRKAKRKWMQKVHGTRRESGRETGREIGRETGREIGRETGKLPGMNLPVLAPPIGKERRRAEILEVWSDDHLKSVQSEIRGIQDLRPALQCKKNLLRDNRGQMSCAPTLKSLFDIMLTWKGGGRLLRTHVDSWKLFVRSFPFSEEANFTTISSSMYTAVQKHLHDLLRNAAWECAELVLHSKGFFVLYHLDFYTYTCSFTTMLAASWNDKKQDLRSWIWLPKAPNSSYQTSFPQQ